MNANPYQSVSTARYLGQYVPEPWTTYLFYELAGGGKAMLKLYDFKKQGAILYVFDEDQNVRVGQSPGVLSLETHGSKAMWALGWIMPGDAVSATLYIEEALKAGKPATSPEDIVALGAALVGATPAATPALLAK